MAQNRKYAALPDLDSAPDTYETPELTDDNSTIPGSTIPRSSSSASTGDSDDEDTSDIDRERLHPDQARTHFSSAQVDARDVDFSDRVNSKRKSYRASNRRRRRAENGTEELGDFSDDEDESLERKFARLRREVQEVKEEFEQRDADAQKVVDAKDTAPNTDAIVALSEILEHVRASRGSTSPRAEAELARKLVRGPATNAEPYIERTTPQATSGSAGSYPSLKQQEQALTKAADLDTRLALLEKALGVNTSSNQSVAKPILPTLDQLSSQLTTLSGASASSLDAVSRKVRQLTLEAERLESTRKAAKAAQDALKDTHRPGQAITDGEALPEQDTTDSEQVAKINALYGTLGTIESLSPILPSVLDRLRSLRVIHADAATASENLTAVEQRQEEMAGEIKRWRDGLEKVESAMKEGEGVMGNNMKTVEGWVRGLEARMKKLDQ
ncbi:MAG: hypothetical protein M1812_003198 [Candelaria pacifica]|nr:MAG: hypothetical protein M1812_003198 [Candelaria pacifica]